MPVILVDRLPLPSLKTYTAISVALVSCSVYYAVQVTNDGTWRVNATSVDGVGMPADPLLDKPTNRTKLSLGVHIAEVITYMVQEPLCIWVSESCSFYISHER